MTHESPRRLRLCGVLLVLAPVTPPRLWRVVAVEGEDEQACAFGEKAGRLSVVQLAARYVRLEGDGGR